MAGYLGLMNAILTDTLSLSLEPDVLAAQHGDRNAFARLVDASRNVVCAITFAIVRDVARSEDLAQEVYVAAWTSLGKLQSPTSFLPWLRQLTRNHAHASIRSAVRYRKRHAAWTDGAVDAADPAADVEAMLVSHEEETALGEAIAELPDETREVVTLYYREGQSARQVGDLLGLTEPAVKKRLERARDALRATTLERLGEVARKSAPTAGFTLAVTAAITLGAPGTAAAATGLAKSSASAGALTKVLALGGGALLGGAAGIAGVVHGARIGLRHARDAEERRGIKQLTAVNLVAVVGSLVAGHLAGEAWGHSFWSVVPYLLYIGLLTFTYGVWLPRITARRLAAERAEDPMAEARQRRDRRRALLGIGFGVFAALVGVAAGFFLR